MTDYEIFKYTHVVYSETSDNAPVKRLEFFLKGTGYIIDFEHGMNEYNSLIVTGITRRKEKRTCDTGFKDYFYLQIGFPPMCFNSIISGDYVINYEEMPVPER